MKLRSIWVKLLVGVIIVLWLIPLFPAVLHYDELSAVIRAQKFNRFLDQWNLGIKPDGHPPLLQLIIWCSQQTLGFQPLLLRSIGLFFGMWSVWESYKLALLARGMQVRNSVFLGFLWEMFDLRKSAVKQGESRTEHQISDAERTETDPLELPGFLILCFMGVWWWSLSIGYQIRPYSLALPFVLKAWAIALTNVKSNDRWAKEKYTKLLLCVAISSWIHHFAAMSALVASLCYFIGPFLSLWRNPTGDFQPTRWLKTLGLLLGCIGLSYALMWDVLTSQLNEGGLSWLGTPKNTFLFDFFQSHLHPVLTLIFILFALLGFIKHRSVSTWLVFGFLIQYLVLHGYSWLRHPVLQPSALYFSLPLLFVTADLGWSFALSRLTVSKTKFSGIFPTNRVVVGLAFTVFIAFLFDTLFLQQWAGKRQENYHREFANYIEQNAANTTWIDAESETIQFHLSKPLNQYTHATWINNCKQPQDLFNKLKELQQYQNIGACVQAGSPPWLLPLLSTFFKKSYLQETFIGGQIFAFQGFDSANQFRNPYQHAFDNRTGKMSAGAYQCPIPLGNDTLLYNTTDTIEFSFQCALRDLKPDPNDILIVIAPVDWKSHYSGLLVESTLHNLQEQIDWRGTLYEDFKHPWCTLGIHAIKLSDIPSWNVNTRLGIKAYAAWAWIGVFKGNPYQYGIQPYP